MIVWGGEVVAAVAAAVVGEDALDRGAAILVGGDHGTGNRDGVFGGLGGSDLDLGKAGVVIDGDIHVLPAGAGVSSFAVLVDAFSDLPETAQLLDVRVHELAGVGVLIPIR